MRSVFRPLFRRYISKNDSKSLSDTESDSLNRPFSKTKTIASLPQIRNGLISFLVKENLSEGKVKRKRFFAIENKEKIIVTTEKDAVRLVKFKEEFSDIPFFVLPITVSFLFNETNRFNDLIINFINGFKKDLQKGIKTEKL